MSLPEVVSTLEMARLLGISDRRVRQLADEGRIPKAEKGRFVLAEAVQAYCRSLRETAAGRGGEEQQLDLTKERARLAKEQADAQAYKNAVLRGELLDATDVEREWADILSTVRARLLALPTAVAQDLPSLTKHEISVVDSAVRRALEAASLDGEPTGSRQGLGSSQASSTTKDPSEPVGSGKPRPAGGDHRKRRPRKAVAVSGGDS